MPSGGDDEALVRRARAGDRVAFGELVRRYQRPVYGFVYQMTGSAEAAEDVTQEVFLRAWRYLDRFDARRPFRPWLFRIAANRAASGYRHEKLRETAPLEEVTHEPVAPDNVSLANEQRELGEAVRTALQDLSPQQRQAVLLVELQGLTAPEAAQAMGCSAVTVRQHVFRAKKRLRQLLAGYARADELATDAGASAEA